MTEKEYLEIKSRYFTTENKEEEKELLNKIIKHNKKLINEFPFLLPINRWSGNILDDYDYSYTELDSLPKGWRIAFGYDICKEIKEDLVKNNFLNDYRILQIKEKFGVLRWYDNSCPEGSNIQDIINKYEALSENICINCGKPADYVSKGWISYFCEDCVKNSRNPESFIKRNEE